jgi:hypothetical protein
LSFATITLYVASQRVIPKVIVVDSVRKLLDMLSRALMQHFDWEINISELTGAHTGRKPGRLGRLVRVARGSKPNEGQLDFSPNELTRAVSSMSRV